MEKVALFVRPDGTPTHAARQLRDGRWTSKLGRDRDISHKMVVDLAGEAYGEPAAYLKREILIRR